MKFTGLVLSALLISIAESTVSQSPVAVLVPLTLFSFNSGVECFFGYFRRRGRATPSPLLEDVEDMSNGAFQFPSRGGFYNPFQTGANFYSRPPFLSNFFPRPAAQQSYQGQMAQQMSDQSIPQHVQQQVFQQMQGIDTEDGNLDFRPGRSVDSSPSMNSDEAESFFTLLSETDESQCISRLICEMGADPLNSGEFGQTITDIIGGLQNFPPGSKVSYYNEVMQVGMQRGRAQCMSDFSKCDDESLLLVKNAQTSEA